MRSKHQLSRGNAKTKHEHHRQLRKAHHEQQRYLEYSANPIIHPLYLPTLARALHYSHY